MVVRDWQKKLHEERIFSQFFFFFFFSLRAGVGIKSVWSFVAELTKFCTALGSLSKWTGGIDRPLVVVVLPIHMPFITTLITHGGRR